MMPALSQRGIATLPETSEPTLIPHGRDRTNSPMSADITPQANLLSKEDREIFKETGFIINADETPEGDENSDRISTDAPQPEVFEGIGDGTLFQPVPSASVAAATHQVGYEDRRNYNCRRPVTSSQSLGRAPRALSTEDLANFVQLNTFASSYMRQHMADMYGQPGSHSRSDMGSNAEEGDNSGIQESAVSSTGSGVTASDMAIT